MDHSKTRIAVVGGGPGGLTALKELRELGFDVTLFERRNDVGGIWSWSEDRQFTTALKETQLCNSKFSVAMSDFPISEDHSLYMSSPELGSYFRDYAKHFDLYKNMTFNKTVTRFSKGTGPSKKWRLTFADEPNSPREFDKVVWATGGFLHPKRPVISGQEKFAGRIIHSQDVRNLSDFAGQNVVVLGVGNTAGDITISLIPQAKKVYISHRRGTKLISRTTGEGLPSDMFMTPTVMRIMWWLEAYLPSVFGKIMDGALEANAKEKWGAAGMKIGGFAPAPKLVDGWHVIVCNEDLIPLVKDGKVTSTQGIKRIAGPKKVEFEDGTVADDVDVIITCTGYSDDMSMLADGLTFVDAPGENAPLPNLYMGIFPPENADSLAHLSNIHLNGPQIPGRELAAMALAQIWGGNSALPSKPTMDAWVRNHQSWLRKRIERAHGLHRGEVVSREWMLFVHDAAGTGLFENIGWSWKAWKLWLTDRGFYNALAHGVATPHGNRVFETGKRKVWTGARQAILDVDAELKKLQQAAGEMKKKA